MASTPADSGETLWTVARLLELFDVQADGEDRYIAPTGIADADERQVVEGTQVLAQAIVAAAKRFDGKSIRSVHSVFARAVLGGPPVVLVIDVVSEGRSTASAIITASQNDKRCMTFTVLAAVPTADVIRHHLPRPDVAGPDQSKCLRNGDAGTAGQARRRRRHQQPRRGGPTRGLRVAALRADPDSR